MNLTEVILACVCWALLVQIQSRQLVYAFSMLHHWQALSAAYLVLVNVRELYYSEIACEQIKPLFGNSLVSFAKVLNQVSLQIAQQGMQCRISLTWQEGRQHTLTQVV